MAPEPLSVFLARIRVEIDDALERYLPKPPLCPAIVSDAMRYSLFAGGKRLRPSITLAAAHAVAQASDGSITPEEAARVARPAACAIEMIHTYSLIHDDLPAMDDDTLRRGRATLHVIYGDGIAILAGDALQAEAFALLAREPPGDAPPTVSRKLRVVRILGEAAGAAGMVGGQAIDLQAAGQVHAHPLTLDAEGLRSMDARKTGALIRAAATTGAVMAGADDEAVSALDRFGSEVGLAFQIVDDILDIEGTAAELGKTAGKDAADAKPTFPALFGLERSRLLAAESIARAQEALAEVRLADSPLAGIATWVVERKN